MRPSSHRLRVLGVALAVALLAAACGSSVPSAPSADTATAGAAFPVTLEHAFGTTEVPAAPQRVVTWGWGSTDAAIALGVVPVAMPTQTYGGDADGVLPWVRERLAADGVELPQRLPDAQEAPVEAIAAARPDLVLAPYSGITQAEYAQLSKIAPTVAYPEEAWATPWRETIEIVGRALGRSGEARSLLSQIDAEVAAAAAAHPQFAGKTVANVWSTPDAFYVYKPADARVDFTLDLGFESAPSVAALASGGETFYYTLSPERLGELQSDVLVSYADTPAASKAFLASAPARLLPQVQRGAVAEVVGTDLVAAVSPPTALSLTWGLPAYLEALAAAVERADAR